jgi:hypothetical protein
MIGPLPRFVLTLDRLDLSSQGEISGPFGGSEHLKGDNNAHRIKHVIARIEFLNALLQEPRVYDRFERWYGEIDPMLTRGDRGDATVLARLLDDFAALVFKEMDLPWRWLTRDLYCAFGVYIINCRTGDPSGIVACFRWADPPAPEVRYSFETLPGESRSAAFQRLTREMLVVQSKLREPISMEQNASRIPADLVQEAQDGVGKYARWFYQKHIRGQSIKSIAKQHKIDRKGVYYGLKQAKKFLSLAE